MSIFVITMAEYPRSYEHPASFGSTRPVGYFYDLTKAKKAVEENKCDYYECRYDFVVIERFEEGAWVEAKEEWWYQWDSQKQCFIECPKPSCFKGLIGFGMG